jgi:integrase/recombinase XerC
VPEDRREDAFALQIEGFLSRLGGERRAAARTVETYGRDLWALRRFASTQGWALDGRGVDLIALRQYLATFAGENGAGTIARKVAALRAFFRDMQRRGERSDNPAARLRLPKVRKRLPKFLSVSEASEVVEVPDRPDAALAARDRAMLELLYGAGLRVSELVGLDLKDVELSELSARVVGKGGKERIVPFGNPCASALELYRELRPRLCHPRTGAQDQEALFLARWGARLTVRQVQKLVRAYGMAGAGRADLHPHALRHSCATHLLDGGADLRGIQELLGHASLSTTQHYTHVSVDRMLEVYDRAHPMSRAGTRRRGSTPPKD